jgi:hypothetical protein
MHIMCFDQTHPLYFSYILNRHLLRSYLSPKSMFLWTQSRNHESNIVGWLWEQDGPKAVPLPVIVMWHPGDKMLFPQTASIPYAWALSFCLCWALVEPWSTPSSPCSTLVSAGRDSRWELKWLSLTLVSAFTQVVIVFYSSSALAPRYQLTDPAQDCKPGAGRSPHHQPFSLFQDCIWVMESGHRMVSPSPKPLGPSVTQGNLILPGQRNWRGFNLQPQGPTELTASFPSQTWVSSGFPAPHRQCLVKTGRNRLPSTVLHGQQGDPQNALRLREGRTEADTGHRDVDGPASQMAHLGCHSPLCVSKGHVLVGEGVLALRADVHGSFGFTFANCEALATQ